MPAHYWYVKTRFNGEKRQQRAGVITAFHIFKVKMGSSIMQGSEEYLIGAFQDAFFD